MAAGEYVSFKAQAELVERELEIERISMPKTPEAETAELAAIYVNVVWTQIRPGGAPRSWRIQTWP
ncbi:MAG: hypothetical protein Ct9H300mP12_15110 [Acidimicrobiales bacterium]|nr:MAG: hypothetical protein Ct9H300mP12_15110 [Acidimicrobiales bacterium]